MSNESNILETNQNPWHALGLSADVLQIIEKMGFEKPTPVQERTIAAAMDGQDLLVSAQTGTGKTAAFVLPLIERVKGRQGTYGLILAPSREIALQIKEVIDSFGAPLGVRAAVLIGGVNMRLDQIALNAYPQILVATPGRLCDHLERGNLWLEYLEVVVLDEADRMLDMGFSEQINRIFQELPQARQTLLFSATVPPLVEKLAKKIQHEPSRISVGRPVSTGENVVQNFIHTDERSKFHELQKLLKQEPGSVFIFTRSKEGATQLWRTLHKLGFYEATHLHSGLRQMDRETALNDFKNGKYRVIIATDVIGRGVHVDNVAHVINYDLPRDPADYVHRIGRTGRAEQKGKATSLVTSKDERTLAAIKKLYEKGPKPKPGV